MIRPQCLLAMPRFRRIGPILAGLALMGAIPVASSVTCEDPIRVVVLPHPMASAGSTATTTPDPFMQRLLTRINARLAGDCTESLSRSLERLRDVPVSGSRDPQSLINHYAADAAITLELSLARRATGNGWCEVSARVFSEGYSACGYDLGLAIAEPERSELCRCSAAQGQALSLVDALGEAMAERLAATLSERIPGRARERQIFLEGAVDHTLLEAFGKVLYTVRETEVIDHYQLAIDPVRPQASRAFWRLRLGDTDSFRVQANIWTALRKVGAAGGRTSISAVPFDYDNDELKRLAGVRPAAVSACTIGFVVDRELARDKDFAAGDP